MPLSSRVLRGVELSLGQTEVGSGNASLMEALHSRREILLKEVERETEAEAKRLCAEAEKNAGRIMEDAEKEAERILSVARQEAVIIVQQAREEGRTMGYRDSRLEAEAEAAVLRCRAAKVMREAQQASRNIHEEGKERLLGLAVDIAACILRRQVELDPEVVLDIAREACRRLYRARDILVFANPADLDRVLRSREELLRQVDPLASIQILADEDVTRGGCRIESDQGVVDGDIDAQLKNVLLWLKGDDA